MAIEEHLVAPSVVGQETFRGHSRLLAHAAVSHDPCVAWVVAGKNGCVSGDFVVVPAEAKRFDDVAAVLGCSEGTPCCCQYWRMTSVEYSRSSLDVRRKALRSQLAESPPGGMLAYLDGEPCWLVRVRAAGARRPSRPVANDPADRRPARLVGLLFHRAGRLSPARRCTIAP
jgi:hypothetical protein